MWTNDYLMLLLTNLTSCNYSRSFCYCAIPKGRKSSPKALQVKDTTGFHLSYVYLHIELYPSSIRRIEEHEKLVSDILIM